MKKILTFIIIIAMTLSLGVPAFAATPATVTVASPAAAVNPGSTVNVAVTIANNPGMDVMKLKFSYDTAALTLKDIELGNVMTGTFTKNLDKAVALLEAAGTTNATGNGTLVTLKFEVKSTATAGNYTIGFLVADAVNRNEERVALTTQAGTVSVAVPVTTYTVRFNANGGTGTMADVTGVPAGAYTLPANGFTAPAGKQFKGWSTGASGAVIEGTTYNVTGDVTLYAIWEDKPHTHTYSTAWSTDETNHWHECTCGDKKDVAAHTPGAAATETTPQTCTICGYVIKAALGHTHNFNQKNTSETYLKSAATCTKKAVYYYSCTCGEKGTETFESGETAPHSYSTEWSSDETNHWHKCANCDAVADKAAHRYDNACDTTCNDCGKTRETSHSFGKEWYKNSEKHWHECSVCHTKKDEVAHIYDNACDKDCNICGQTREVTHSYSEVWSYDETNHWHECSVCHTKKDETPHTYDNACDTTCNDCGKTREITHSYSEVWSNDETNHWHECSVCHTKKDEAAHIPGAEATETTAQTCTVCGYVIKAPLGHTHRPTIVRRVEPTCEKAGNIEHYKCSCGKLYYDAAATKEITNAAKIILSATGHARGGDWKYSEIYHWHECAVCGERMDTAFHRAGAEATETTPQTCAVCGYVMKEALGHTHSFTEKNTDAKYLKSAATCKASAEYYYSCSCGEKGTETFKSGEKLAHNFKTEWSSNGEKHWHECSLCGEKNKESSHRFEWKTDKAATATEAGSKHEECTVCGYKKTAIAIDKLAPSIIDGRNAKWNKGGENNLTFKSDAVFSDFVEVLVDGKTIAAENYEKREGSIIIELKASYLETLAEGEHTLTIRSASGGATTKFTVEAVIVSPPTSSTSVWVWIIIAVVALGVGATIVVFVIRKRKMA